MCMSTNNNNNNNNNNYPHIIWNLIITILKKYIENVLLFEFDVGILFRLLVLFLLPENQCHDSQ